MKKFKLCFVLFVACTLSSCGVLTSVNSVTQKQTRGIEPKHVVYTTPLVVDVEPIGGDRVSYTANFAGDALSNHTIDALKVETLSQANEKHGADLMVASTYTIVYSTTQIKITVTGFPAKYTKLRNANSSDDCSFMKSFVVE